MNAELPSLAHASRVAGSVLLRAAILVIVFFGTGQILDRGQDASSDADIGGGAVLLLVVAAAVLCWSWYDGAHRPSSRALGIWVGTGLLLGSAMLVVDWTDEGLVAAALLLLPFVAIIVIVPAVIGVALGGPRWERRQNIRVENVSVCTKPTRS